MSGACLDGFGALPAPPFVDLSFAENDRPAGVGLKIVNDANKMAPLDAVAPERPAHAVALGELADGQVAVGSAQVFFLSCLCGSELAERGPGGDCQFLSCLCGSEPSAGDGRRSAAFLSCLCGSEPQYALKPATPTFLSCLCGSERLYAPAIARLPFLSCLCGSEHCERGGEGDD